MIYSVYDTLTQLDAPDCLAYRNKLIEMDLAHIFDYAWNEHHAAGNFKAIVLFTVYTYSWETTLVVIGKDWLKTKIKIAQKVKLPVYLYDATIHLKNQLMSDTFQDFMYLFSDNMDFVHLTSMKELYQQVMTQSTRFDPDEHGNNDLPQKIKYIEKAAELKDKIEVLESSIKEKYRILNAAKTDFKFDHTEHGNPLKLENSNLIRG